MRGHIFVATVFILATAAVTDGIGLGDVYRMFKHGEFTIRLGRGRGLIIRAALWV